MSFVDRYWEWRCRRALEAPLGGQERARDLALVAEVVMEHRGVTGHPQGREQAPPADQSPAASELSVSAPSRATRNGLRKSWKTPVRWTGGDGQTGANGAGYSAVLAAIDGTSSSAEVGRHAVRLAENLGAKLFVLSFVNARPASRMGRGNNGGVWSPLVLFPREMFSGPFLAPTLEAQYIVKDVVLVAAAAVIAATWTGARIVAEPRSLTSTLRAREAPRVADSRRSETQPSSRR